MIATLALASLMTLAVGDTVVVDGSDMSLTFVGVPRDSRCPRDVQCIVAGEAHGSRPVHVFRADNNARCGDFAERVTAVFEPAVAHLMHDHVRRIGHQRINAIDLNGLRALPARSMTVA